ncbi:MAG: clan AA aspartic protease [Gammaproteobacteria bacterium]|nr:clan AA aspartic protease [Gammaproteobacteria bacterium]
MGLVQTKLKLSNPSNRDLAAIEVKALADTGALHLCIPEHIALQLEVTELEKREAVLADGRHQLCPYVGPIQVEFDGRRCFVGALVLGDSVLLGAIPMEDMDLVVIPAQRKIMANPENPNIPLSTVK